ncbi:SPOR domain-containing protein [Flavobacteriaceae bacterium]|nr:SPOR domain-containing protein [Flavobacteriaceae bacterium]
MPFIDEKKIADLYKEVDDLRNSSSYFQDLYLKSKKKIVKITFYKYTSIIAFSLLIIVTGSSMYQSNSNKSMSSSNVTNESDVVLSELNESLRSKKIYTVQIGASQNDPFLLFSKNLMNFNKTKSKDYNLYSLGNFDTKEEAEAFRKEIVKLGIDDAWVVAYENGKRIISDN